MSATTSTLSDLRQGGALMQQPQALPTVRADFFDLQGFELLQRVAKAFASSTLVPQQYQGNVANCMIALNLARRLKADELMVMQNLYIVHGNPGWSSKFLIASVNTCGRFSALRYEWRGQPGADDFGCRAWTIEKESGERLNGVWVDWKMVKAEGWNSKSGSKWKTMPEQMFVYRSAAFWTRAYAPEISMGLSTAEELADVVEVGRDGTVTVTSEYLRTDMPAVPRDQVLDAPPATAPASPQAAALPEPTKPPVVVQQHVTQAQAQPVGGQEVDAEWEPSPEELAAIHQRELEEAGMAQPQQQPQARAAAPAQQTARRGRAAPGAGAGFQGSLE